MSEILTVDAILFGLLVFSGIIGNILVINVVRENHPTRITKIRVFSSVHLSVLADTFIQCDLQRNQSVCIIIVSRFPWDSNSGPWRRKRRDLALTSITNDVKNDTEERFS